MARKTGPALPPGSEIKPFDSSADEAGDTDSVVSEVERLRAELAAMKREIASRDAADEVRITDIQTGEARELRHYHVKVEHGPEWIVLAPDARQLPTRSTSAWSGW